MRRLLACALVLAAVSSRGGLRPPEPSSRDDVVVFAGVNVVPMDEERVLLNQSVVVRGDRIAEIGGVEEIAIPPGAFVIWGRGRWLVPGLVDMHVHVLARDLRTYVDHGITTVRDLAGLDSVLALARRTDLVAPRIVTSSKLINGPNPRNPMFSVVVNNVAEAEAMIDVQRARGCEAMKLYENLPVDVYDAAVDASHARGMRVAGHVSALVDVRHAMTKQDSIEHLSGYERAVTNRQQGDIGSWVDVDTSKYAELARLSAESGVWNCPTLYVYGVLSGDAERQRILDNRRIFVRALRDAGARILAGTDAGYLVPATALFDELDELRASGLTPYEVLTTATHNPAQYLGLDIGVIAAGARADLVLVSANPLDDLSTLRTPAGVMVGGRWLGAVRRRVAP